MQASVTVRFALALPTSATQISSAQSAWVGQRAAMLYSVAIPLVHSIVALACLRPVREQRLPVPQYVEDFVLALVRPSCLQHASSSAA